MNRFWPWRRAVQAVVLASLVAAPVVARYNHYLHARQLDKVAEAWRGTWAGRSLQATDAALRTGIPDGEGGVAARRPRRAVLERGRGLLGSPWSMSLFGLSLTDLLAGVESAVVSGSAPAVLLLGLLVPLAVTLLLGRVYCAWACPMGLLSDAAGRIRDLLGFLELRLPSARVWRGTKYLLLGAGLVAGAWGGVPLLHALYPPALLGREAHGWVAAQYDRAEAGQFDWTAAGLTGAAAFLAAVLLVEILVAPRAFCRSLCPGGALYSLAGAFRVLRVRRRAADCDPCSLCNRACPRGLAPMTDRTGPECDTCAACIDACPSSALTLRLSLTDAPMAGKGAA